MTSVFKFGLIAVLAAWPVDLIAQQGTADYFRDENGNTWHNIFLDFRADELIDMHYLNDINQIQGELSPDGYSVTFKNYDGQKQVVVRLKDHTGQIREVTKSKCFIDPVLLHL